MAILYAQTTRSYTSESLSPTPIPELSLELPEGAGEQAVIILNTEAAGEGPGIPGGYFRLSVDGVMLPQTAAFSATPLPTGNALTIPCTLVAAVPLKLKPQKVQALWYRSPSNGKLSISISSLTAIIA